MTQKQTLAVLIQELNSFDGFGYDLYSLHYDSDLGGGWAVKNTETDHEIAWEHRNFTEWKKHLREEIKKAKSTTSKPVRTQPMKYTHELGWHE